MVTKAATESELEAVSLSLLPESTVQETNLTPLENNQSRSTGILVIEDNRLILKALKEGLRMRGFLVWTATDGSLGVTLYQRCYDQINVVLSDVKMPVLNGPKTLDALRKINPTICFCFMTGDTRATVIHDLLRKGAIRVFTKPFSSVAAIVEELWDLATNPPLFSPDLEIKDGKSAARENTTLDQPALSAWDGLFAGVFSSLLRSVTGMLLLLKRGRKPPSSWPPT